MASFLLNLPSEHLDDCEFDESTDQQPLLVIGIGIGRTGIMSLKKALEILHDKPCYHMSEIILHHKNHIPKWIEIFKQCQQSSVDSIDPTVLGDIFRGYALASGNPACSVYEKLIEVYPEAKLILTTRDSQEWLESFHETLGQGIFKPENGRLGRFIDDLVFGSGFKQMAILSMRCALGWDLDFSDDEALIRAYETRNQDIQNRVPPERLLCFDVKEGWKPLCKFLNLPIPDEPFPRVNDREEMQNRLRRVERLKMFVSWGVPTLAIIGIGLTIRYGIRA